MKHTADIAGLLTIKCCLNYKHKLFSKKKKKKIYYTKMHRSSTKVSNYINMILKAETLCDSVERKCQ